VIVVDDGSTDGSATMLTAEFPSVRVVALSQSIGFGAACNRGFAEATRETVLLLNSDMAVTPGSIAALEAHLADESLFAVGPRYYSDRPGTEPGPAGEGEVFPHIGAPAGGGLFRREAFLTLGGFDPLYAPFYWEDLDLGWAAWRAGWRIVHDARVRFNHLESVTIRRLYSPQFVARVRARNRALFGWKWLQDPGHLRICNRKLLRHAVAGLLKRRDSAPALGLLDALRMKSAALAARPQTPASRSEAEILDAARIACDELFSI
jgi:GT2 family glycosyltransferase